MHFLFRMIILEQYCWIEDLLNIVMFRIILGNVLCSSRRDFRSFARDVISIHISILASAHSACTNDCNNLY